MSFTEAEELILKCVIARERKASIDRVSSLYVTEEETKALVQMAYGIIKIWDNGAMDAAPMVVSPKAAEAIRHFVTNYVKSAEIGETLVYMSDADFATWELIVKERQRGDAIVQGLAERHAADLSFSLSEAVKDIPCSGSDTLESGQTTSIHREGAEDGTHPDSLSDQTQPGNL